MTIALNKAGFSVNRKRTQRLMAIMGLEAIYPRPKLSTPNREHKIYPYLLRSVPIERVNQVWGVDITYVPLRAGFAYLVAFVDWFSRFVLSFTVSTTLDHQFCLTALNEALQHGKPEISNSDQGSQFTCIPFISAVQQAGIKISMDGRGRALDNVFTERLWRSVKYEDIYLNDYHTPQETAQGLKKYFGFYNHERPHQSLGYKTPADIFYAAS